MCLSHQVVGSLGSLKQAARRALARSLLRYGGRVGRAGRASRGECGACEACRAEASPLSTAPSRNCGSETARSPRLPSPRRAAPRARRQARRAVCDTLAAGCVALPRERERCGVVVRVWRVVRCAAIAARPLARHAFPPLATSSPHDRARFESPIGRAACASRASLTCLPDPPRVVVRKGSSPFDLPDTPSCCRAALQRARRARRRDRACFRRRAVLARRAIVTCALARPPIARVEVKSLHRVVDSAAGRRLHIASSVCSPLRAMRV